jgi:hypothetical protein
MQGILYGADLENGRYRFLIDQDRGKIRLYKKTSDNSLIPLTVWTLDQLIQEMLSTDE